MASLSTPQPSQSRNSSLVPLTTTGSHSMPRKVRDRMMHFQFMGKPVGPHRHSGYPVSLAKTDDSQLVPGSSPSAGQATTSPATKKRVPRSADVSSGQLNFGCEETKQGKTPEVSFGANPSDIQPHAEWVQMDNVKGQNQQVIYDRDSQNQVKGISAEGSITGLDKQVFNCPGGARHSVTPCHLDGGRIFQYQSTLTESRTAQISSHPLPIRQV